MAGVGDLQAAAAEYLAACAAALDALTEDGAPARQFVSHGPPAWDCCPMLAVHVGLAQPYPTSAGSGALAAGHRIVLAGVVTQTSLTATVLRCTPSNDNGDPVAPALLTAAAATTNADLWAIWNWLIARKADETLFGGRCRELALGTASALAVEGLCAGWQIPIALELDGFRPEV